MRLEQCRSIGVNVIIMHRKMVSSNAGRSSFCENITGFEQCRSIGVNA